MELRFKGLWLPAGLLANKDLSAAEKILLADINAFDDYWKSNKAIGEVLNVTADRAGRIVTSLEKKGYIKRRVIRGENGQVVNRILEIVWECPQNEYTDDTAAAVPTPPGKNTDTPGKNTDTPGENTDTPGEPTGTPPGESNGTPPGENTVYRIQYRDNNIENTTTTTGSSNSDRNFGELVKFYNQNIAPITPFEVELLTGILQDYPLQEVWKAMKITASQNRDRKSMKYILGILKKGVDSGRSHEPPVIDSQMRQAMKEEGIETW